MTSRREILTYTSALVLSPGCLEIVNSNPSDIEDYSIPIVVENNDGKSHSIQLKIGDEDGKTYKQIEETVEAMNSLELQPFTDLKSTGLDEYLVIVSVDSSNQLERTVEMNRCYSKLIIRIDEDGGVRTSSVVC